MRRSDNIFEKESYCGNGTRAVSGVTLTFIIMSVLSAVGLIAVIARFDEITVRIATFAANLLSSGCSAAAAVMAIFYFITKLKWRWRRWLRR